jgi:hypothetical protein
MVGYACSGQTPPAAAPSASIEGRVLQQPAGQPLVGVDILVNNARVQPVKSGAGGKFRFEKLAPGRYALLLHPASGFRANPVSVELREGESATGITINAFAGASVSGLVLNRQKRPVEGLRVSALRLPGDGSGFLPYRSPTGVALTNDLGEFQMSALDPGRYAILVEPPRRPLKLIEWNDDDPPALPEPEQSVVETYYPDADALAFAQTIQLEEGQKLENADVILTTARTFCIRSRAGNPGETASRNLVRLSGPLYWEGAILAEGEVLSGTGFEICGLPRGDYSLLSFPASQPGVPVTGFGTIQLTDRPVRVPNLELRPLVALSGHLSVEGADREPKPLTGAVSIGLAAPGRQAMPDERRSARATAPGAFTIPAVLPAEYQLTVQPPNGYYVKSATIDGRDALRQPVHTLGRDLRIVLGPDAPRLSVVVTGPEGAPVPGAAVIVAAEPLPSPLVTGDLSTAISDQRGRADFMRLAPGRYRVLTLGDVPVSPASAAMFFLAHRDKSEEVLLAPGENRSLTVRAGGGKE